MAKVVNLATERVKRDLLDMADLIYGGRRPAPGLIITDPRTAAMLGWRPTPEESRNLGWANVVFLQK